MTLDMEADGAPRRPMWCTSHRIGLHLLRGVTDGLGRASLCLTMREKLVKLMDKAGSRTGTVAVAKGGLDRGSAIRPPRQALRLSLTSALSTTFLPKWRKPGCSASIIRPKGTVRTFLGLMASVASTAAPKTAAAIADRATVLGRRPR